MAPKRSFAARSSRSQAGADVAGSGGVISGSGIVRASRKEIEGIGRRRSARCGEKVLDRYKQRRGRERGTRLKTWREYAYNIRKNPHSKNMRCTYERSRNGGTGELQAKAGMTSPYTSTDGVGRLRAVGLIAGWGGARAPSWHQWAPRYSSRNPGSTVAEAEAPHSTQGDVHHLPLRQRAWARTMSIP